MNRTCLSVAALLLPMAARAVTMDMVAVGDPGNAPDPLNAGEMPGIGAVDYSYQIGKFEVINSQYVEFLNAVASDDTYGLYSSDMDSGAHGGIVQSGSSGSYTYAAKAGYENLPVVYVSFYDAVRFVNWLENGQPTGAQGEGTTETGSYTLFTVASLTTNVSARASTATWVIPTEDEWYKAAYYDPAATGTSNYWLYPTRSDEIPNSRPPNTSDPNSANLNLEIDPLGDGVNDGYATTLNTVYFGETNYLTPVGAYSAAASYYGTFDQAGNVYEWNEATSSVPEAHRGLRGADWGIAGDYSRSSSWTSTDPWRADASIGFRVAAIPEPAVSWLVAIVTLYMSVWRHRKRLAAAS